LNYSVLSLWFSWTILAVNSNNHAISPRIRGITDASNSYTPPDFKHTADTSFALHSRRALSDALNDEEANQEFSTETNVAPVEDPVEHSSPIEDAVNSIISLRAKKVSSKLKEKDEDKKASTKKNS